jgi:hypothetical protein
VRIASARTLGLAEAQWIVNHGQHMTASLAIDVRLHHHKGDEK